MPERSTIMCVRLVVAMLCAISASCSGNSAAPDASQASDAGFTPDLNCTALLARSAMRGQGNAVLFEASDCEGIPVTNLDQGDFVFLVDNNPLSSEASATIVPDVDIIPVVYAIVDMSASTGIQASLAELVAPLEQLTTDISRELPNARIGVVLIDANGARIVQEPTAAARPTLSVALSRFPADLIDSSATDLFGGLSRVVELDVQYRHAVEAQLAGAAVTGPGGSPGETLNSGAFTRSYAIIVSDGRDTAGQSSLATLRAAIQEDSQLRVFSVPLATSDLSLPTLQQLGSSPFDTLVPTTDVAAGIAAAGDRIIAAHKSNYVAWLCLPRQTGQNSIAISTTATSSSPAQFILDATPAEANCVDTFLAEREANQCGALLAGVCATDSFCNSSKECEEFLLRPRDAWRASVALTACPDLYRPMVGGNIVYSDPNQLLTLINGQIGYPIGTGLALDYREIRCLSDRFGDDCTSIAGCFNACPPDSVEGQVTCVDDDAYFCRGGYIRHLECEATGGTCDASTPQRACTGRTIDPCVQRCDSTNGDAVSMCWSTDVGFINQCDALEFSQCDFGESLFACRIEGTLCETDFAACNGHVLHACDISLDCRQAGYAGCVPDENGRGAHCTH